MDKQWQPLELIKTTADFFTSKGVPSPRLDAEVLLCEVLECSRIQLYSMFERALTSDELDKYREMVRRRAEREPVSRILGKREFMGLDFKVTSAVLSPRPETEILVEQVLHLMNPAGKKNKSEAVFEKMDLKLKEFVTEQAQNFDEGTMPAELAQMIKANEVFEAETSESQSVGVAREPKKNYKILDIGTGSGCIAISVVACERNCTAVAVDISTEALEIANENAHNLSAEKRIDFRQGDLFSSCNCDEKFDFILSNPPYIPEGDNGVWPEVAKYDPDLALYAGVDGLDCYRRLIPEAKKHLALDGYLLLEIGAGQFEAVKGLIHASSPLAEVEAIPDHAGIERVVVASGI